MGVTVGVLLGIFVGVSVVVFVGVLVGVAVGVDVGHGGCTNVRSVPGCRPAVSQENWVYCTPVPLCTPIVALPPLPASDGPYTRSNLSCPS